MLEKIIARHETEAERIYPSFIEVALREGNIVTIRTRSSPIQTNTDLPKEGTTVSITMTVEEYFKFRENV